MTREAQDLPKLLNELLDMSIRGFMIDEHTHNRIEQALASVQAVAGEIRRFDVVGAPDGGWERSEDPKGEHVDFDQVLPLLYFAAAHGYKPAAPAGDLPINAPKDVLEWIWHMDLHLTEHDERHAGLALRAAWPHVRAYLVKIGEDLGRMESATYSWARRDAAAEAAALFSLAERCRPAVAHDARLRERDVHSDKYAPSYKTALQAAAERAGKLLDDIDAIIAGDPVTGPLKLDTDSQVFFYEQDHYYLSNFSAFKVWFEGHHFDTSEQAYHFLRFPEPHGKHRHAILFAESAHDAFRYAQEHKSDQRPDWDATKVGVMKRVLRAKVDQHEYVRRKLLQTGDRELVENSWRDPFWGWGPNRDGLNMLGKVWMEVRDELRQEQRS